MRKSAIIWLIVAALLIIIGSMIFVGLMSAMDWDFLKLNTSNFETNEYIVDEKFDDLSLNTETAEIEFLVSDDNKCKVVCYEQTNSKHKVDVKDKTLNILIDNQKKWFESIGFNLDTPKITVYVPNDEYEVLNINSSTGKITVPDNLIFGSIDISLSTGDVSCFASCKGGCKISTSTGNIQTKNISAESLELSTTTGRIDVDYVNCQKDINTTVSTGKTHISNIECNNFTSSGSTGSIVLEKVIAKEKMNINRSTGNITFVSCDASDIHVKTSTGDVKGSFLPDKIFIANSSTGSIDVPKSDKGEKCEINTDTGDIHITTDICIDE